MTPLPGKDALALAHSATFIHLNLYRSTKFAHFVIIGFENSVAWIIVAVTLTIFVILAGKATGETLQGILKGIAIKWIDRIHKEGGLGADEEMITASNAMRTDGNVIEKSLLVTSRLWSIQQKLWIAEEVLSHFEWVGVVDASLYSHPALRASGDNSSFPCMR